MSNLEEGFIGNKYVVDTETIETCKGTLNTLKVNIFQVGDDKEKIGSYQRNYPHLDDTFFPFICNGKEVALYSKKYMYTRVMELPSCKDIGGEEKTNVEYKDHFCPVEIYVPIYRKVTFAEKHNGKNLEDWLKGDECFDEEYDNGKNVLGEVQYCDFGFVAGCFWGDNSSWKIQFLDLSEADKGIIKRDGRLGYLELPKNMKLKDAIDMNTWEPGHEWIGIVNTSWINYATGETQ